MCDPLARSTKNGSPPTPRNARTGEFTPPGMSCWARAKRESERGEGIGEGEGGEVGEAIVEGAGGFASADGEGELGEDIAGIEAFGHIHDSDA